MSKFYTFNAYLEARIMYGKIFQEPEEFDSSEILTEELIKSGNFAHKVKPWIY